MSNLNAPKKNREDHLWQDLVLVIVASLAVFVAAASIELNEKVLSWTRPLERWQIDEIPEMLLAFAIGMGWFAHRRRREVLAEISLRVEAQRETVEILDRNRELSQALLMLQDKERLAIARDLHDELGQSLTAIKFEAASIRDQCNDLPELKASSDLILKTAEHVYAVVRSLLLKLRPATLDNLGLPTTLRELVDGWQQRHNIDTTFRVEGDVETLGETININLYRIVQEGLTNIAKHAEAGLVGVELRQFATSTGAAQTKSWVKLSIEDNGVGMIDERHRKGLGLLGMQERVRSLGGVFSISKPRGTGTLISITIPVDCGSGN